MPYDVQNLGVTTDSEVAIAAINRFIQQSLSYGKDAEAAILEAIAADPNCVIAHAYAASYYLSQENQFDRQRAKPYLRAIRHPQRQMTTRESLYTQGILAWAAGDISQAIALHEAIVASFPQDLISVQQGQYHYFYQGDAPRLLQIAQNALAANSNHPDLLAMLAFGLEQCHQLTEAEAIGRQATALNRQNPWAHHAVAHVMETQKRTAEGIDWMLSHADTWEFCNSMLYTHNWWHVALFYLQQQDISSVFSLYDKHVWGRADRRTPKDQVGAIALLLRLELQGVEVGSRWQSVQRYLADRIDEHALPFQDLHYIYALARSQQAEKADEMLISMIAHAQTVEPVQRQRWLTVAVPAAKGMIAYAKQNWQESIAYLKPVIANLWQLGGSHAQHQLFQKIYTNALQQSENRTVRLSPFLARQQVQAS